MSTFQPIQLISAADGWRACWRDDDGQPLMDLVACWCLVQPVDMSEDDECRCTPTNGLNEIHGYTVSDFGLEDVHESSNFAGYVPPGQTPQTQPWWTDHFGKEDHG